MQETGSGRCHTSVHGQLRFIRCDTSLVTVSLLRFFNFGVGPLGFVSVEAEAWDGGEILIQDLTRRSRLAFIEVKQTIALAITVWVPTSHVID